MDKDHTTVVTGYLRRKYLTEFKETDSVNFDEAGSNKKYELPQNDTDVTHFIYADDNIGPYNLVTANELVDRCLEDRSTLTLLVPLPRSIWVGDDDAEKLGAKVFYEGVSNAISTLTEFEVGEPGCRYVVESSEPVVEVKDRTLRALCELRDTISAATWQEEGYCLRSYVVPSTDFKSGYRTRCAADPVSATHMVFGKFPKYVWVIEVMKRKLRSQHPGSATSSVIGEVVMDATDVDHLSSNVLAIHMPGIIQTRGRNEEKALYRVTGILDPYRSGRSHASNDWMSTAEAIAARGKSSGEG